MLNCPKNTCAYIVAIDMIRYSNFIRNLDIENDKYPHLIKTLLEDQESEISKSILEIW